MSEQLTKCERCGTELALVEWPNTEGKMDGGRVWMEPLGWTRDHGARVWMSHTTELCEGARKRAERRIAEQALTRWEDLKTAARSTRQDEGSSNLSSLGSVDE